MLSRIRNQIWQSHGYAVAEFAITLPVLIALFSICVWIIGLGVTKIQLENISNNVARTVARGELFEQTKSISGLTVEVTELGNTVGVQAKVKRTIPLLNKEIELTATAKSISEIYDSNE